MKKPKTEPVEEEDEDSYEEDDAEDTQFPGETEFTNETSQHSMADIEQNPEDSVSSYHMYTPSDTNHQAASPEPIMPRHMPLPPLYRCPPTLNYAQTSQPLPPQPQPLLQPQSLPQTHPLLNSFVISNPRPAESSNINQDILLILKNQMAHQTKVLEHISQVNNNVELLLTRQVSAIERQTESVRRQAIALEHHTLVMNSFVDMIRDKMPKNANSNIGKTTNLSNGK